jgi:hypothetical protein
MFLECFDAFKESQKRILNVHELRDGFTSSKRIQCALPCLPSLPGKVAELKL